MRCSPISTADLVGEGLSPFQFPLLPLAGLDYNDGMSIDQIELMARL